MSQYIENFINRNFPAPIQHRGRDIMIRGKIEVLRLDTEKGKVTYRVQAPDNIESYRVSIHDFDKETVAAQCNCMEGGACKHIVAALLHLNADVLKQNFNPKKEAIVHEPITARFLQKYAEQRAYTEGIYFANNKSGIKLKNYNDKHAEYRVRDYDVMITSESGEYSTSCTCDQRFSKLCSHKVAAFIHFGRIFGEKPFETIPKLEKENRKQLLEWGYPADEKSQKLFTTEIANGKLTLIPKDKTLVKINAAQDWKGLSAKVFQEPKAPTIIATEATLVEEDENTTIYVFKFDEPIVNAEDVKYNPYNPFLVEEAKENILDFKVSAVLAKWKKDKISGRLQEISVGLKAFSLDEIQAIEPDDADMMQSIRRLQPEQLTKKLYEYYPELPRGWVVHRHNLTTFEQRSTLRQLIGNELATMFRILPDKKTFIFSSLSAQDTSLKQSNLDPVQILRGRATVEFSLDEEAFHYVLTPKVRVSDELIYPFNPSRRKADWIYKTEAGLALLDERAVKTLDLFPDTNAIRVKKSELAGFLSDFTLPLMNLHNVELNVPADLSEGEAIFSPKVYLSETEEALTLTPVFSYDFDGEIKEFEMNNRLKQMVFDAADKTLVLVYRNDEKEGQVRDFLKTLHPSFMAQSKANPSVFQLGINELFENEWFFSAFEKLKSVGIEVLGFSQLQKLKYNPNRAKINIRASSGIDWFDLEILVSFGEQSVALKDVRKAIFNRQHYIRLGDGTLGILPQEWIEKYASVLKMGQLGKGDTLRMSNFHLSLIDELYGEIDGTEVFEKLIEKRLRLKNFEQIEHVKLPKYSTAELRGYQVSGYNWLNFLDEFGWGGILADDMGLGKTVQAITFLQRQAELKPNKPNLVVVPKSLVFNWQKECEKFAPEMKILVYYGTGRKAIFNDIRNNALTITTYGAIRSDIRELREIDFNYVILDESQAIKNPDALATKAVKLLSSHNRLTLTGTPIENNVFDLYSQMDFLNPGMLGNVEFFKKEFATPIDRDKDLNATKQLRKLVYPFILRRTKEEVAKELPEKMESVIFCEMEKQQRRVYDAFKDKYRDLVLGKIDSEGMNKAGVYILEGLMKLRQICDSPAILNEKEDFGHESVKMAELIPRIQEDSGRHKTLVFSQFLGMLDLIRKELDKLQIPYEYLDGSTTDRQERVERFQNNDSVRVFLMSLKAGGVGLNLTAADYVYIVDPWWNPAVEAQAIDRTHRIGQEKPVFAYKMICKDTVEEKILLLQEKKKALAADIVHVEAGFVKALTRDDVVGLFS
jgi:SNF2 family DNA or RNA helicase